MSTRSKTLLTAYAFPLEQFASLYLTMFRDFLDKSKYAEHSTVLYGKLAHRIYDYLQKQTYLTRAPLMTSIIKYCHKYSSLIDEHPTVHILESFLLPQLVEVFKCGVETYAIHNEAGYDYNHLCFNYLSYQHRLYKNKLQELNGIRQMLNLDNSEDVSKT